ncbi:MAG: DUF3127 domain-containing protein [Alloprevotella sp.]|nr:DUF3127 domain-containing protein [Alloprevotella sp.]
MELTGKITHCLEARSGVSKSTGNSWMSQEYVMEYTDTNSQYPRHLYFNVFGEDRIKQFNIQVGQELTVSFDIDAREYNGRWFADIRAWRVQPAQGATAQPPQEIPSPEAPFAPAPEATDPTGDLPF